MERPIRVAIMGCGWAGVRHAQAYKACGAEVRWAVDVDRKRAEVLRELEGRIHTAADYREALDDPGVDAVDICLPHHLHAPVAVEAAEAGKHVLCPGQDGRKADSCLSGGGGPDDRGRRAGRRGAHGCGECAVQPPLSQDPRPPTG